VGQKVLFGRQKERRERRGGEERDGEREHVCVKRACVCEGERVPAFALACLVQCS